MEPKKEEINAKKIIAVKVACSRLSDSGEDAKNKKAREKLAGGKKEKGRETEERQPCSTQFPPFFIFVFALSQFSGPDYPGAWNRLQLKI